MFVFAINIALVIAGIAIPIGAAIFWSMAARISGRKFDNNSAGIVSKSDTASKLVKWLYQHRSKFNVIIGSIVTIIEFFAVMPF